MRSLSSFLGLASHRRFSCFDTDQVIFQYSRAAKELWKFCNLADVELTARVIGDRAPADWWERGAPRRR